ncbi:ABC transporter ATP-binding protein [Methanobrevibacter oralis]|uniref:ABC transporter ATP-binding protein n=1 Tax=Methanobrevibacter oralis TaxID=66851 RepID=UPI001C737D7C|nr:ABC transporter ATP-binding protein [Methanobrevibacter oralis]
MYKLIFNSMTFKAKGMLAFSIFLFVLYSLSGIGILFLVLEMISKIIEGADIDLIFYWILLIFLLLVKVISNGVADILKHFSGFEIVEKIRSSIILKLKKFSLGFYTNERLGEISMIIHKDVDNMEGVVAHMWSRMISDFIIAILIGILLTIIKWQLALVMMVPLPFAIFVLYYGIKSGKNLEKILKDNLLHMASLFVEYVKGIPLIKAFNKNKTFENKLKKSAIKFAKSSQSLSKFNAKYLGLYNLILELGFSILLITGAYLFFKGNISISTYLIFIIISREFYKPFFDMEFHWLNYIKVSDSYKRILKFLNEGTITNPISPKKAKKFNISFEDVEFSYEDDDFKLKKVNFEIAENTLTALVGPSGSGKTTVTNLLLRFWNPNSGRIKIGDINIEDMDYDYVLSNLSIVMQNVILFADTIYNNIKIGNKNANREEVIKAAKKAMIHDFIMTLPENYDTIIGENGLGLSGGQKQRISIARAFLQDAPILILDEITSNVDPINESKIQEAISELVKNKTILVIAHNLNSIKNADNILVFDNGQIVQKGVHNDLIKDEGLYKNLWNAQSKSKEHNFLNI